jgi:hypothetical protein
MFIVGRVPLIVSLATGISPPTILSMAEGARWGEYEKDGEVEANQELVEYQSSTAAGSTAGASLRWI